VVAIRAAGGETMTSVGQEPGISSSRRAVQRCLLLCAGCADCQNPGNSTAGDVPGLESLLRQGVDWPYLLDLGRQHGLLPLAYDRLRRLEGGLVPLGVMAHLQSSYHTNLRRNLRLGASLAEAVTALREAGIEPIVVKGGALAGTVYPDPGLRPMVDLDLLVLAEDMERAGSALAARGYHLTGGLSARMVAFQQRFGGGLEWVRQNDFGLTRIDLQHDLVGVDLCRHAFAMEPGALWTVARPLPLVRGQALQLSAEDALIHLCLHPALHHGYASPIIGYIDVDRLVRSEGTEGFWQRLVQRAGQFRARIAVYHVLRCVQHVLGTPVPGSAMAALAPGGLRERAVAWLAPLDERRLWAKTEQPLSGVHQLLLYAALMERPRHALGMVRAILFPGWEWLAVRYGLQDEGQARRYGLVHPFRVARAFARGLFRPLRQSGLE
jgi:hypothetical protein